MFRAVFLLIALAFPAFAEDFAFVKSTDFWRVQPYTANAAEPREGWTQDDYDDSSWMNLQASFCTGYGGNPLSIEQTILPQNVVTYCFRDKFTIGDPNFVQWLTLRIDYESGFVAYLNGNEIARHGFADSTNPIPLGTIASPHSRGRTEWIDVSSAIGFLRSGTNVLAIQLHSGGVDLPSLMMATELVANFTRGPFLQNVTTNSIQIVWRTQSATTGSVEYGKDLEHLSVLEDATSSTNHAPMLSGLEAGTDYIYRIYAQGGGVAATSDWSHFRTLNVPGAPIHFVVVGDTGQALLGQYKIAEQMKPEAADLVMHVGDVVYPCFLDPLADARTFSIYRDQMMKTPFFTCLGNHDSYCGRADYLSDLYLPTNSVTGNGFYYSFDHGDAHFVVLDTDIQWGQRYDTNSLEFHWLEADLAATTQPWRFIFFHHVIRSSSYHGLYDDFDYNIMLDKLQLQATIGALAARYGAQMIFNGHDHDYERFASFDGYNSIVSGGGGAALYGQYFQEEGSVHFSTTNNFLRVTLNDPELTVEAVNGDGVVFDRFYRSRVGGGPGPFASKWESPLVEAANGSDLAGNIPGQTFNFSGEAMRTAAGKRANLGHVHVRNDRGFLYLGFESATIWKDQVIALFVESASQPGTTNLAELGNGVADGASGEGADGLDLLTNLTFRNFHPSVAALLGDEKADSTQRNFQRAGMRWAVGQGVFHLDAGFTTITGARMQQFNRSPQTTPPQFFDDNADFIEVAIPLSELGNPQFSDGGGQIKIGAIVFGDLPSGPMSPQIDTAFAGNALDANEDGTFTLEPTMIQLAPDPDPSHDEFNFTATAISETQLHFEWNTVVGGVYTIQSTPALGQSFQDVNAAGLPVTAADARTSFDLVIDGSSPVFYRLRAN